MSNMGPVSALLLTICLANLVSSQSTEMDSGQCEQSNAVIYDIAEDGKATGADVRRQREELTEMKKEQQHLYTVIEEMRQMLKEIHSTTVNVSLPQCPGEFLGPLADVYHWVGGNDIVTENEWVWRNSGERFTYTNWSMGQPGGGRGQNCLMLQNGKWIDYACNDQDVYICERKGQ